MSFVMGLTDHLVVVDFGTKIAEGAPGRGPRQPGRDRGLSRRRGMSAPILVLERRLASPTARWRRCASVSLVVQPGSIVTVIGANGAGKTHAAQCR